MAAISEHAIDIRQGAEQGVDPDVIAQLSAGHERIKQSSFAIVAWTDDAPTLIYRRRHAA